MTVKELLTLTHDLHDAIVRRVVIERSRSVQISMTLEAEIRGSGEWRMFELVFHQCSAFRFVEPTSGGVVLEAGYVENELGIAIALHPLVVPVTGDPYEWENVAGGDFCVIAARAQVRDLGPCVG